MIVPTIRATKQAMKSQQALLQGKLTQKHAQSFGVVVTMGKVKYRDLAVFTIVQDEPEFIHPWINHYQKHVNGADDIYVLNHYLMDTEDKSCPSAELSEWIRAQALLTTYHGVTSLPVHHNTSFDHQWLADTVFRFQVFLLQSYKWVLFAEADEFVLPNPERSEHSLLHYVRALDDRGPIAVRSVGFEVVQQENELPLPPDLYRGGSNCNLRAGDLLASRQWWCPSELYSKTLLANIPTKWEIGFHQVVASEVVEHQNFDVPAPLTLVHLHKVDFDLALRRLHRSRARRWPRRDVEDGLGYQNRLADETSLRAFWQQDPDTGERRNPERLSSIPVSIRQSLR
jgi:hypothetical protein